MKHKLLKNAALVLLAAMLLATPVLADGGDPDTQARVTLGADLSVSQREDVYAHFGIEPGSVPELTVTIEEERAYLGDLVPAEKIGKRSLSCIYIKASQPDAGITVTTDNINWVTPQMYIAALTTAGVKDAQVMVTAPTKVSGTAALTGIFKAYESIAGEELDQLAKDVATEELVTTGELSDLLGSDEATQLINELKKALAEAKDKSPEELRQIVLDVAVQLNISLTDEQVNQLVSLLQKLAQMDLDPAVLLEQAQSIQQKLDALAKFKEQTDSFFGRIASVWQSFTNWLARLFGG